MFCKKCGSDQYEEFQKVRGKQRYRCLTCHCHFVEGDARKQCTESQRLQAVGLCSSGLSMNHVAKLFGVAATSVQRWIKRYVPVLCPKPIPKDNENILVLELDEMWHYLKKNPTSSGSGRLIVVIPVASSIGSQGIVIL